MRLNAHCRKLAICSLLVSLFVGPNLDVPAQAAAAAPVADTAVPLCGVVDLKSVTAPTMAPPTNPVHVGPGGFAVSSLVAANDEIHVLDVGTQTVRRFTLDGAILGEVAVPFRLAAPSMVVDPDGNLYLAKYPATLVKLTPTGQVLWSREAAVTQEIDGVFATGTGSSLRIGVVGRGEPGSALFDLSGSPTARSQITGTSFSPAPDGGLVTTDGRYVRRYDGTGSLVSTFGDARTGNDPAPTGGPHHFYQQGGAVVLGDGTTYVADATRGIAVTSSEGFHRGTVPDEALGFLTERSALAVSGERLYFAAGGRFNANQHVAWISLADLAVLGAWPKAPASVLGYGAGLTTGVTGNYFVPGRAATLTASFDPWWARHAPDLRLAYTVRDRRQILAGTTPSATELALPTTAAGLANMPLTLPASLPGFYEVDARLLDGSGAVIGATCLTYTVGAPGQRLDFATLPPGADFGGPTPARGVALADVLGTGNFRAPVDWSQLLPDIAGPMRFEAYDGPFADAAREAAARQVAFHVQVGVGGPVEKALVQNGTWGARVKELVAHFKGTVSVWEAWNEPNLTYGSAEDYVAKVLRPFSEAVKSVDPAVRVIGGSVVGMDLGYYDAIGRAGGFSLMDVVAIHPYTGHNRSWEEQGTPASIQRLRTILATYGAQDKPVWNTESAWWADGPANYLSQADKAARALIWMRALGVERWSYFMMEGGYGDYGFSYSLIQSASQPDDYVKPAALATMTAAAQMEGRPFSAMVDTGIPHVYAASFGADPEGNDSVVAAWTDDLALDLTLVAEGTTSPVDMLATDVLGAATTVTLAPGQPVPLALSGSPVYLTVPTGARLRIAAVDPFGINVAAAAAGATATASSANAANPPARAIDGVGDAGEQGDLPGLSAWASAPGDASPSLTVKLSQATEVNRVLVSTHSIGSIVPGLRTYDVSVQDQAGAWTTVGAIDDQFFARRRLISFAPRLATAIRVSVRSVNYGGLAGGLKPWFWATDAASAADASSPWYGPAVVYEVEAFAGGSPVSPPVTTTTTAPIAPTTTVPVPTTTTTVPIPTTSTTIAPAPAPPTNVVARAVSVSQIKLSWLASSGATSYRVERSRDGVTFKSVVTGVTATSYDDTGLVKRTRYYYRVVATNVRGDSQPSATTSTKTFGLRLRSR